MAKLEDCIGVKNIFYTIYKIIDTLPYLFVNLIEIKRLINNMLNFNCRPLLNNHFIVYKWRISNDKNAKFMPIATISMLNSFLKPTKMAPNKKQNDKQWFLNNSLKRFVACK